MPKITTIKTTLGIKYFTLQRYCAWNFSRKKFARSRNCEPYTHIAFTHHTPLLRKLKNVDLWLQQNKIRNLHIAVKRLNGIVIHPGETFSYWRLIGKPTRRKGYSEGMVLLNGRVITGVGGGLCQLSNLIYWLTLHTPLTVIERYRHNFDVFPDSDRKVPFGSGATCFFNYIDLQIFNGTNQPYQLHLYLTEEDLVGEWRTETRQENSYQVYQKDHWITNEYPVGYMRHNTIYRKTFDPDNILIGDEFITENHARMMYEPLLPEKSSTSDPI